MVHSRLFAPNPYEVVSTTEAVCLKLTRSERDQVAQGQKVLVWLSRGEGNACYRSTGISIGFACQPGSSHTHWNDTTGLVCRTGAGLRHHSEAVQSHSVRTVGHLTGHRGSTLRGGRCIDGGAREVARPRAAGPCPLPRARPFNLTIGDEQTPLPRREHEETRSGHVPVPDATEARFLPCQFRSYCGCHILHTFL